LLRRQGPTRRRDFPHPNDDLFSDPKDTLLKLAGNPNHPGAYRRCPFLIFHDHKELLIALRQGA
jgi:hypothetical protein